MDRAISNKDSLDHIKECIDKSESFILEAGAGSGKTWTLVESLKYIIENKKKTLIKNNQKIVCITYTNVAKNEIIERTYNNELIYVGTIHEFLWSCIKNYQKELKQLLVEENSDLTLENSIQYENYPDIPNGIISHNDVLKLAQKIFNKYPLLSRIIIDSYPYIFVDEYQDTQKETIDVLLNVLLKEKPEDSILVIGFFGDSMQSIYPNGIESINNVETSLDLKIITKEDNYRCSRKVIDVLNHIRTDFKQKPAGKNLEGSTVFLYCSNTKNPNENYDKCVKYLSEKKGWDFDQNTKILFLTHRKISSYMNFDELFLIFNERYRSVATEQLNELKNPFIEYLIGHIEKAVDLYTANNFNEFFKIINFKLENQESKKELNDLVTKLVDLRIKSTIKGVIDYATTANLFKKTDRILNFEKKLAEKDCEDKVKVFYEKLMSLKYEQIINFSKFTQEDTPFSTKHGIKGAEFDNVLVVIDDTAWNLYSFSEVFGGITIRNNEKNARYYRTLKLLYVCCSRSKNNLAVLFLTDINKEGLKNAESWFGTDSIVNIS